MGLGREIARMRQKKNLTQKELAEMVGISEDYLSRIETEEIIHPHIKTITRILSGLGTNMEELLKDG